MYYFMRRERPAADAEAPSESDLSRGSVFARERDTIVRACHEEIIARDNTRRDGVFGPALSRPVAISGDGSVFPSCSVAVSATGKSSRVPSSRVYSTSFTGFFVRLDMAFRQQNSKTECSRRDLEYVSARISCEHTFSVVEPPVPLPLSYTLQGRTNIHGNREQVTSVEFRTARDRFLVTTRNRTGYSTTFQSQGLLLRNRVQSSLH